MTLSLESNDTIAVAGGAGSYSEWVGQNYMAREGLNLQILYVTDSIGVLQAMAEGRARLGVLPMQNSTSVLTGVQIVPMTEKALKEARERRQTVNLVSSESVPVTYDLCTQEGVELSDVTKVVSHEQVLAQCSNNLAASLPGVAQEAYQDSALAGDHLLDGTLPRSTAVILPTRYTETHPGLRIHHSNFQDNDHNRTFFTIVSTPL